jgi:guanylate kinase
MVSVPIGHRDTRLIVVRGNSGAGKSSVARELRRRHGRGCALVELSHRPLCARDVRRAPGY